MDNTLEKAVKGLGRQMWEIVKQEGIKSLDIWTTSEPGTVTAQLTDADGAIRILYLKCEE